MLGEAKDLLTKNTEKAELLNFYLQPFFLTRFTLRSPRKPIILAGLVGVKRYPQ